MKGFATIGIACTLAISAGLGYFLAVVRNDTPPSSARKPLTENTSAKADAREIELPVAEASPLFRSHLAFLEKINAADFEELWNLWEDPNTNLLNHNDILDRLIDLDPIQLSDRLRTSGDQKKCPV